jgi:hypothetical protein
MKRIEVAGEWIYSAISDFYFAFSIQDTKFRRYATFFDIMAVEKICKGILLFHNDAIYKQLPSQLAKQKIEEEVKIRWGHNLKKMLKDIDAIIGSQKVDSILSVSFDGFTGRQFVKVIEKGYMESRYPTANPIYRLFPIKSTSGGSKLFFDPLESSGLHKFAYRLSQEILLYLKGVTAFPRLRSSVKQLVGKGDTGRPFTNLFFQRNLKKYL